MLLPNFKQIKSDCSPRAFLAPTMQSLRLTWKNKISACPHKHHYTAQTCSSSSGFSHSCSCNYLL